MEKLPHPSNFDPALIDETLNFFAALLLEMHYQTKEDLSRPEDDNYTFGTTSFGRGRRAILNAIAYGKCPHSVKLIDQSNKLIFAIGQAQCRFFYDDYLDPRKKGAFIRIDDLFPIDAGTPVYWNFVVQDAASDAELPRVIFCGYDLEHKIVSFWEYGVKAALILLAEEFVTPKSVELREPRPKDKDENSDDVMNFKES